MNGRSILLASAALLLTAGMVLALEVSKRSAAPAANIEERRTPSEGGSVAREAPRVVAAAAPTATAPTAHPPVAAAPARGASARRDALLATIRGSGTAPAPLARRAAAVLADWQRTAPADLALRVQFGPLECHARGCFVEAIYPDQLAFEQIDDSIVASAGFQSYPGWRHRAGPIDDGSGKLTATWFFMPAEPQ